MNRRSTLFPPASLVYRHETMRREVDPTGYLIAPDPGAPRLTSGVRRTDHDGCEAPLRVVKERPLTLHHNGEEIRTEMTIGDCPEDPAVASLNSEGLLRADDTIYRVVGEDDVAIVVVPEKNVRHRVKSAEETA